jgi:hypothetical protein
LQGPRESAREQQQQQQQNNNNNNNNHTHSIEKKIPLATALSAILKIHQNKKRFWEMSKVPKY